MEDKEEGKEEEEEEEEEKDLKRETLFFWHFSTPRV